MPSLGRYCQGVIRYRVACQASADTSIILCKEKGLRLWRCFATETLLSHFMQVRSKLPAQSAASSICEICLAPRWSWELSSTWKPSRHHRVASIADSRRAERGVGSRSKSQTRSTLSLHRRRSHRQSCPTLLASTLPKTRSSTFGMFRGVSVQSMLRKRGRNSSVTKEAALLSSAHSSLKLC